MLTTAGTGHADPYAPPAAVPELAPSTLDVRFAAGRRSIEKALATAQEVGDKPWSTPGGGARAVYAQALSQSPQPQLAVVAWLGYAAPGTFSSEVLTGERAGEGGAQLRRFLAGVHRVNPSAAVGLLCHSYGSVVCGRAALDAPGGQAWRDVTDIALYGSPGTTAWSAAKLSGAARVWAGRGTTDWTEDVPHVRIFGLGLGPDPVSPAFGARVFDAGSAGHSDYLEPGSTSLRNLTGIALGRTSDVTRH